MTKDILSHFKAVDPKIYPFIKNLKVDLTKFDQSQYFFRLSRAIAFQQLHGKAATTIWNRFEELFPKKKVEPNKVLELSIEQMRAVGFSNAKSQYIKNIAEAFLNDANYLELDHLSDEEVIELLTKIKGVGRWTAEMFLMFTLGREDIFSVGDFGLRKGLMKVYNIKKEPSKKRMEQITKKWIPYRTYGSLALWEAVDNFNP